MENTFTQAFPTFSNNLRKQALKYLVQRTIFCKYTGSILDMRTAIMMDVEDENKKTILCEAFSPTLVDRLQSVKDKLLSINPKADVKFYTSNKKLKNELLTKL